MVVGTADSTNAPFRKAVKPIPSSVQTEHTSHSARGTPVTFQNTGLATDCRSLPPFGGYLGLALSGLGFSV